MINNLVLKNFKSFKGEDIQFGAFTLFAGSNASGKSTILQSLLIFKQADLSKPKASLHLNGDYINLGPSSKVIYEWAENDTLEITLGTKNGDFSVKKLVTSGADDSDSIDTDIDSAKVNALQKKIRYLSAMRITPDETYKYSALRVAQRDLGPKGEYTIAFLSANHMESLRLAGLRHPDARAFGSEATLAANLNAWMQSISSGVDVTATRIAGTNLAQLKYGFTGSGKLSDISSHNVGFGLTYTLPIVTLVLSSEAGDVLIIENPEAHVHPAGQMALGKLLATAAVNGVQVIVETHSDHLFNGIRLFIKDNPAHLSEFNFYFVDREPTGDGFTSVSKTATVSAQGKFTSSPNGFFDAWEKALFDLVRP